MHFIDTGQEKVRILTTPVSLTSAIIRRVRISVDVVVVVVVVVVNIDDDRRVKISASLGIISTPFIVFFVVEALLSR